MAKQSDNGTTERLKCKYHMQQLSKCDPWNYASNKMDERKSHI